ncbi:MAG: hypothetical protein DI536_20690 [Archangium gephyra]|uniref:Lipoprotein n=1 Tax=Archangium gephyra TaxID=48 RepID=A0A2W5TAW7_9BACT|nr:MAG: hypothetical protein DI536_20690 [Archangium gephyra]
MRKLMKLLTAVVVLIPTLALADVDQRFAKLRDQAEAMGAVSAFVDKYVGDCASKMMGGGECEKNAEIFRQGATGKKFYMIITEETSTVLSMGEVKSNGQFVLNLTPFFAAAGMAITHGAPTKTDGDGNPVMPFIRMDAVLPDGWNPAMMQRQVQGQALRLQIVFTPQGVWTLPKKGGGQLKGVKAKFEAVLVSVGRTGDQVGLWLGK